MHRHACGLLTLILPPLTLILASCSSGGSDDSTSNHKAPISKVTFQSMSLEDRMAYCNQQQTRDNQTLKACLAMARDEPGFPNTVSEADIKHAFELCRAETQHDNIEQLARCGAWKLNLAQKKPTPDYRWRHMQQTVQICVQEGDAFAVEHCISALLPYVFEQDMTKNQVIGSG